MKARDATHFHFLLASALFVAALLVQAGAAPMVTSWQSSPKADVTDPKGTSVLNPNQPTYDFDFGSLLYGPPPGNDQQVTLAVDSVNGSDANAGSIYAPKLTLPTGTLANGAVLGVYRGSTYRKSLPLPTSTTHSIVVQDMALGSGKGLPVISALDPVNNASVVSSYLGATGYVYRYSWTPTDSSINNGGYDNVYLVEINTATEGSSPIASRRRMTEVSVPPAGTPGALIFAGSAQFYPPGTGYGQSGSTQWRVNFQPSDNVAPGRGTYRYEVVSRVQPANWGSFDSNVGDGAMSGLMLVGGSSGYGSLGAPRGFVGDRLVFLHGSTHNAVINGGSLQRSVFYEEGDDDSIQLAWYAGTGTGLGFNTSRCLFYANVGDRHANGIIAHTSGSTSFDRGDISDCAFLGARWSNGALEGTAIAYNDVATGTVNRVYVQGVRDPLVINPAHTVEVKNSVFRGVHSFNIVGSIHDNIVQNVNGGDPNDTNNRNPVACTFQQSGASATNNLLWAHTDTVTGLSNDDQVAGVNFSSGSLTNLTFSRNILVLDPVNTTVAAGYAGQVFNGAGMSVDYNLIINLSKKGIGAEGGYAGWAAYLAHYTSDQHSLYVDLSSDSRGLKAVFVDPANGDFRWADTVVGGQCAAFCTANNVGPATVTTHWPTMPTVDTAVAAVSLLPPKLTSPGAVTFTNGVYSEYKITTDLDSTPEAPTHYSVVGQPVWSSVNASSGVMSGTPLQTGSFGMSVSATNLAGTGSASLGITVQTAFKAWQNACFTAAELNNPAISGPNATPVGDGISNVVKYALGLNPKINGTSALPTVSFTAVKGLSFLTLTYNKSLAASDVSCAVEVSSDLRTWSSDASSTATVSTTSNPAGTMQTVVQRDLTPTGNAKQRFIRLKISQP